MDYPTHVVIKSAKVIPIMVMGFFILGVRPSNLFLPPLFQNGLVLTLHSSSLPF